MSTGTSMSDAVLLYDAQVLCAAFREMQLHCRDA